MKRKRKNQKVNNIDKEIDRVSRYLIELLRWEDNFNQARNKNEEI